MFHSRHTEQAYYLSWFEFDQYVYVTLFFKFVTDH